MQISTSLVPRPRPAFHHLQHGKLDGAWEHNYTLWFCIGTASGAEVCVVLRMDLSVFQDKSLQTLLDHFHDQVREVLLTLSTSKHNHQ